MERRDFLSKNDALHSGVVETTKHGTPSVVESILCIRVLISPCLKVAGKYFLLGRELQDCVLFKEFLHCLSHTLLEKENILNIINTNPLISVTSFCIMNTTCSTCV